MISNYTQSNQRKGTSGGVRATVIHFDFWISHVCFEHRGDRGAERESIGYMIEEGLVIGHGWLGRAKRSFTGRAYARAAASLHLGLRRLEPNKTLEPTPTAVTDRAAARSAPAVCVAHL